MQLWHSVLKIVYIFPLAFIISKMFNEKINKNVLSFLSIFYMRDWYNSN